MASRLIRSASSPSTLGRPPRFGYVYFLMTSRRCQVNGRRGHSRHDLQWLWQQPDQPGEQETVGPAQARLGALPAQDRYLAA